jgi:hypothetical protein
MARPQHRFLLACVDAVVDLERVEVRLAPEIKDPERSGHAELHQVLVGVVSRYVPPGTGIPLPGRAVKGVG